MLRVITPSRMQAMEKDFMRRTGTSGLVLMERAAQAVADALADLTATGAVFLCGPGNNGGDGYAAARLFAEMGRVAWVWALSDPEALSGDARENWLRCVSLGIPVAQLTALPAHAPDGCGAVVDALFGTGLARPLDGLYAEAVRWINAQPLPVLAVDMPSGTPELMVRANTTVAFHQLKPAHILFPGRTHAGRVIIADIGIAHDASPEDYELLTREDIPSLLPPRPQDAHKGTCGHALLLAGSPGMAGAAALSANATLRGGAGLVTVACGADILPIVQTLAPCATCVPRDALANAIAGKAAIGAGPGLGQSAALGPLMGILRAAECPQVWDADALNWLATHPDRLPTRFVLTPHPGEAARLLDCSVAAITADPLDAAQRLHEKYGATILLKGATTVIIGKGQRALNTVGSPGMATGGSGDVLTGLILALLAQGIPPFEAAQATALLHGAAGEVAAKARGVRSMTAMDLLDHIHID